MKHEIINLVRRFRIAAVFLPAITLFTSVAEALTVNLIPLLPPVITNADLSHMDIYGTGAASPMFTLRLDNTGDTAYSGLRLRYLMHLNRGLTREKMYEGVSNKFDLLPGEIVIESSSEFLFRNNPSAKISIQSSIYELNDQAFKQKLLESQHLPDGEISFEIKIEKNSSALSSDEFSLPLINSSHVECVSPGTQAPSEPMLTFNTRPVFIWTSDLPPGIYAGQFELCLYKARSGESMAEAVGRPPVFRQKTSELQFAYPFSAQELVKGATYYWQVTAFLKGLSSTSIKSNISGFRIQAPLNAETNEILEILRLIYDESVLEQVYDYSGAVTVRINGEVVNAARLREMAAEITAGRMTIQSTTVR